MSKPRVIELIQTCWSCPAQWKGRTDDGRHIYIRYRWGHLGVGIADGESEAVGATEYELIGNEYDGEMTESDMMQALGHKLDFSGAML